MKYQVFSLVLLWIISGCAVLNKSNLEDSTLLTINGDPTIADEFIYVYEKNNFNNDSLYFEEDVDEYFDLFVKFKLKVEAAKSAGIDTSKAFIDEFNGYKDQLIKPYLSETKEQERLVEEAYERMKYEVDASHILISVDQNAAPEDTAKAYQTIAEVYQKAKSGEDFEGLAMEFSQDPSAKTNKGRLGYFTAFQMVFAFEEAAFNTPVDSISDIIRSRFGYHILKVHDKRQFSGKVKVSHILITNQNGTVDENTMKNKIFEIHDQLSGGADWNELCQKYSEDQRTKNNGGTLPFIGLRQINDEAFENVAFNLQTPGEISDPVRSKFGWHIIKFEERQGLQPFEELKEELEQKVARDDRSRLSKKAVIANLKEQNNFQQNDDHRHEFLAFADSTLLQGKWNPSIPDSTSTKIVFSIAEENFSTGKVIENTIEKQKRRNNIRPEDYLNELLDNYIEEELMDFEEKQLIASNRDFRMLLNEYYEGILLFEIMNQKVWGKAVEDTVGLQSYFEENQEKYRWNKRADAVIFESTDEGVINSIKNDLDHLPFNLIEIRVTRDSDIINHIGIDSLIDLYQKYPDSRIIVSASDSAKSMIQHFENNNIVSDDIILADSQEDDIIRLKLNSNSKKSLEYLYNQESALTLRVEESLYERGDNQIVDSISWETGMQEFEHDGTFYLVEVREILDAQLKKLEETKGAVISDYQEYLEKTWIEELKQTFTLEINNSTLGQIKSSFKKKLHSSD